MTDGVSAAFWEWCASRGIEHRPLSIGLRQPLDNQPPPAQRKEKKTQAAAPPLRGLFSVEALPAAAVVLTVPYAATIGIETAPLGLLPAALPSARRIVKAFSKTSFGRFECQYLWLAVALAGFVTQRPADAEAAALLQPYLAVLPRSGVSAPPPQAAWALLDAGERARYADVAGECDAAVEKLARLTAWHAERRRFTGALPSPMALDWGYRTALARATLLPCGCDHSAPEPLAEWLAGRPQQPVLPALVPVVDLINSPDVAATGDRRGNCALFTCRGDGAAGNVVAVATTRAVAAGEELLLPYDMADRAVGLYKHGFVDPLPRA
jgi:hypothetical protein